MSESPTPTARHPRASPELIESVPFILLTSPTNTGTRHSAPANGTLFLFFTRKTVCSGNQQASGKVHVPTTSYLHDLYRYYPLLAAPSNVSGGLLSSPFHLFSFSDHSCTSPLSIPLYLSPACNPFCSSRDLGPRCKHNSSEIVRKRRLGDCMDDTMMAQRH